MELHGCGRRDGGWDGRGWGCDGGGGDGTEGGGHVTEGVEMGRRGCGDRTGG